MSSEANLRLKLNKRLKISNGKSNNDNAVNRKFKSRAKDEKHEISRGKSKNNHVDGYKNLEKENGEKGNLESSGKDKKHFRGQGNEEKGYEKRSVEPMNADRKRKRIYADSDLGRIFDQAGARNKNYLSKKGQKEVELDFVEQKSGGKPRTIWEKGLPKKEKKIKPDSNKNLDASEKKFSDMSRTSLNKTISNKKSFDKDLQSHDDQPKKKKRLIRIDPYDISNKRLDDGLIVGATGSAKEKKEGSEKKVEMSMNAKFRAIQPSPSIISFVEENLLGRRRPIELRRAGYNVELSSPLDNIPFSTSSERERIEENMFRNKLEFFAAAKVSSSFPAPDLPEIAFAVLVPRS